jgi:lipoprotein-releasing system permease protein
MYKLLLCQRYLRTRYIALASIVSVTLGVATMIVVNSVMAGFGSEMRSRIQGILSDIIVETRSMNGEFDPEGYKIRIRELVGKYITGVTATVEVHAILSYKYMGDYIPHPINLVGIDPESKSEVGPLIDYLQSYHRQKEEDREVPAERDRTEQVSWNLSPIALARRQEKAEYFRQMEKLREQMRAQREKDEVESATGDPFSEEAPTAELEETLGQMQTGRLYVGVGLATYMGIDPETKKQRTYEMIRPGDDVRITTYSAGTPAPKYFVATVVDTFKTGMSEYDSNLVYCNLEQLQDVRGMIRRNEDGTETRAFTSLQIKLKNYKDAPKVIEILKANFPAENFNVNTWEQRQGPLLAAVDVESSILNILLFLIITVAGFGILAIFFMIVVEKTRDIGILKALGASSSGVMSIFLTYGLLLGMVGAGAGVGVGLLFVYYINQIETFITFITGREVFPEKIYYFKDIPTHVDPFTVCWVAFGAVMIAVLASVLPARRASRLRPVQALRYE